MQEENQIQTSGNLCEVNRMMALLNEFIGKKQVIELYSDPLHTDKFSAGYILAVSSEDVIMAHIAPNGVYDGFMLKKANDIFRVDTLGEYDSTLQKLYTIQSQTHPKFRATSNNLVISFLDFAKSHHYVTTIQLFDSGLDDIQGFVEDVDDNIVIIGKVTIYGEDDGRSSVRIDNISFLTCDSDNEHAISILAKELEIH